MELTLTAVKDPGSRTPELDSQLYFICVWGMGFDKPPANLKTPPAQEGIASAVVWANYTPNPNPAFAEVQAILEVYDKLFPSMHARMDLLDEQTFYTFAINPPWSIYYRRTGGPESVTFAPGKTLNAGAIPYYLTRDREDPRFMPTMRNLSPNKLFTVLSYVWNLQQGPASPVSPRRRQGARTEEELRHEAAGCLLLNVGLVLGTKRFSAQSPAAPVDQSGAIHA